MQKSEIKIIFMGTPEFAANILETLMQEKYNIVSVYTRQDKKVGRKQILSKTPVKEIAQKNEIPVFSPEKFDEKVREEIKKQKPDLIIVSAYGKIIPKEIINIPKFGIINTHPSALPKYRGASPIQNVLLNGEKETATTLMLMNEEVDAGDILAQKKVTIKEAETVSQLSQRLSQISAEMLIETIPLLVENKIKPQKQNDELATSCQIIRKEDGEINWNNQAQDIFNCFRAFDSWPGIFTYWKIRDKKLRIKLNKISLDKNSSQNNFKVGEIFLEDNEVKVKTKKGNIVLEEIQMEGKKNQKALEFVRGYPNFPGSVL